MGERDVLAELRSEAQWAQEKTPGALLGVEPERMLKLLDVVEAAKEMRATWGLPSGDRFGRQLKAIGRLDAALAALDSKEGGER